LETMPLILKEVLSESLVHTATMLPVLFLAFIIVEFASHRTGAGWLRRGMAHPYLGPVAAAGLGLLPQCGFSVATTSLFLEGMIPTGSLLASYIATSDEAVPILLSNPATLPWVLPLLATKLVWGAVAGIAVNLGSRHSVTNSRGLRGPSVKAEGENGHTHDRGRTCVGTRGTWKEFVPHAFSRAVRIAAMVFVLSSLFNVAGHLYGHRLASAAAGDGIVRPLAASFLGLIPSCATSVVLAEGFSSGLVSFAALVSGLTANAGVGLLVLVKESRNRSRTLGVIALLVLSAFISGTLAALLMPA
jgi:hypothetical protein